MTKFKKVSQPGSSEIYTLSHSALTFAVLTQQGHKKFWSIQFFHTPVVLTAETRRAAEMKARKVLRVVSEKLAETLSNIGPC